MIGGAIGRLEWNSTGPGSADADPPELPRKVVGLGQALLEELVHVVEHEVGAGGDVVRLLDVHDDLAGEVGDGDVDARGAQVGDEQMAGVRPEAEEPGRPPAGRRPELALGEEPVLDELGDSLGHDCASQARRVHQPRPGRGAVRADEVEHRDEAVEALLSRAGHRSRHADLLGRKGY